MIDNGIPGLVAALAARIRAAGPISVADYMAAASDAYYGSRDPFGAAGDFITAPEISQVFGELIGLWCAELWQRLGAPDPILLVELGPGRGTLMADALRAAAMVPAFARALRLHLVERSPFLRRLQAENLGAHAPQFHDDIAGVPPGPMLLIANEFLDALPIRQFEWQAGAWHERRVGLDKHGSAEDGEALVFQSEPGPADRSLPLPPAAEDGAIAELSAAGRSLIETVARRIAAAGGAALFIDYGYERGGFGDTLQAVRRHRSVPVLDAPGSADVTAHVDFAAMAAAAEATGAAVYGPVPQREFLIRLGIETRATRLLADATPAQQDAIRAGCRRLIDPGAMGDLFKVLALGQRGAAQPEGFAS